LYRSAIEELARGANRTELDIAARAVVVAMQVPYAHASVEQDRRRDPGYHLLADGRRAFETAIGFRPPLATLPGRLGRAFGIGGYVASGSVVAALLLAIPLFILHTKGVA